MPDSFDHPRELSRRITRSLYLTAAFVLAAGAMLLWSLAAAGLDRAVVAGLAATVFVTASFAVSAWQVKRGRLHSGIGLAAFALAAAVIGLAIGSGRGVHTAVLGGLGAIVIVCSVLIGRHTAIVLAAAMAVALVAIFVAESAGLLASPAPMPGSSLLLAQLFLLGMGLLFGLMAGAVVEASAPQDEARAQRFRTLLGIGDHGALAGYRGVGRGVTAEIEARQAALPSERRDLELAGESRRSEKMLARLFEASPDAVCVSELETGEVLLANERFCTLLGHPREALIDRSAIELGIWARPAQRHLVVEALQGKGAVRNLPITLRTRDGRSLTTILSAATMVVDDRTLMVSTLRDVTANAQTSLQQQAILRYASIGIAFTRDRVFEQANPRFEEMFGWPPGTLVGQPGAVVWRSEADYAQIGQIAGPLLSKGRPVDFERLMRRRDGGEFWCRMRARVVDPEHPATGGTIWIAEDITDSRATAQALEAAKEAAEAANRAKSAFVANMSHEIRTPLNGVLGLARLALNAQGDAQRSRDYLQRLIESAEALGAIISDTLDLSKIEAGKLTIETVDFDLRQVLDNLCATFRELAAAKGLASGLRIDEAVPQWVSGDPVRLRQILSNFASNAIKFTERGRVGLHATAPREGWVRFSFSDSGIGIDEELRARLFRPFSQGDDSTTRRFGGTGLGLSICRELATLMGGEVGFDSTPGVGSTFWVELPLPAAAARPGPAPHPTDDAQPLAGLRVLLVEDNPVNMLIAEQLLEHWGAAVTPATDGRQAIEIVGRQGGAFDAVLMDVHMPVMGGHEATRALRERFDRDQLPIVALTAAALVSDQQASLDAGMNDFIAKPIDAQRMIDVLLRVTEARRAAGGRAASSALT